MSDDRTIHGRTVHGAEIVRYNRSGKWYVETTSATRRRVSVDEAARLAEHGFVYFNRPGGLVFERRVRALAAAEEIKDRQAHDLIGELGGSP